MRHLARSATGSPPDGEVPAGEQRECMQAHVRKKTATRGVRTFFALYPG